MDGFTCVCLGDYSGGAKDLLHRYKEQKDYELRSVFLYPFSSLISSLFHNCVVTWAPSSPGKLKQRGFDHMEGICQSLRLEHRPLLIKDDGLEQKASNREERLTVGERIHIAPGATLPKKVLLIDDVVSTGGTLNACYKTLKESGAKKVYALVLMDNTIKTEKKQP